MKRLFVFLGFLATSSLAWGGNGAQLGVIVSTGTSTKVSGYVNDDGAMRQAIIIGDRSSSNTLTVDAITGITVNLASSSATGIGSLSAGTAEIGNVKNSGTFAVQAAQSGAWTVSPGTGTVQIFGPVTQSGAWTVSPGTGTYTTFGPVTQSGQWVVSPGTGLYAVAGVVSAIQSGSWSMNASSGVTPVEFLSAPTVIQSSFGVSGSSIAAFQGGAWSVNPGTGTYPVAIQGTPTVSLSGTNLVVSTSAGISVQTAAGVTTPVGYQTGGSSVPVYILNGASGGTSSNYSATFPSAGTAAGGMSPTDLMMPFALDASSNIKVNVVAGGAAGGTSSNFSASFPSAGTAVGGMSAGGNMMPFAVDASSFLKVNVAAGGAGGGAAQFLNTANSLTTPSYVGTISSFPVNVANLPSTQLTATGNALDVNIKTQAVAYSTSAAISIQNGSGVITPVGFQVGGGSVPVVVVGGASGGGAAQFLNISNALTTPSYVGVISSFPVNVINTVAANVSQVGGNAVVTGGVGEQVVSVDIRGSSNTVTDAATSATGSAVPTKASYIGGNGSGNLTGIVTCDTQTVINTSSSGDLLISSASAATTIYVCNYNVMSGGTTNVKFVTGAGTTCGTTQGAITGAYPLIAQTGIAAGNGLGVIIRTQPGFSLCINNSAAVSIQGVVNWTKF